MACGALQQELQADLGGEACPPSGPAVVPDPLRDFYGVDVLFIEDVQMTRGGDWAVVAGVENLRRAILRRLVTKPGEFALRPGYGAGVMTYVKKRRARSDLDRLKHAVEGQLAQEKRLERSEVTVTSYNTSSGLAAVRVSVRARVLKRTLNFRPFTFTEDGAAVGG